MDSRHDTEPSALPPAPARVVVVDDQHVFRQVARELLEFRGYAVVGEAAGAVTGLEAVRRLEPDAVLLDVRLGDGSGFDVAFRLTRAPSAPAVLLVSSDLHLARCHALARASGAVGVVAKSALGAMNLAAVWPTWTTAHAAG